MNQDMKKTVELAKVYENQGYYKEALEIYSFLDKEQTSDVVKEGLKRMGKKMEEEISDSDVTKNISKGKKILLQHPNNHHKHRGITH